MNTVLKKRNLGTEAQVKLIPGHSRIFSEILSARGYNTPESIRKFLEPSEKDFFDPFLLKGMKELTKRLEEAAQNNETVVVYGDYDADGICSTVMMSNFLEELGVNVIPYIPSRHNDGYGLNIDVLDAIIERYMPDLIITCDCGISAYNEVEYALELGVDIIITDHHEVPTNPPECIIVNPKQSGQNYPFDQLCGAGVVLKVIQAMRGIEAGAQYYDLCALATVADLVPLVEENRIIVHFGLKKLASPTANLGLKSLIEYLAIENEVTSGDLAYKVSPRINAAGRLGDAYRAFELLTATDRIKIFDLIKEISADNDKRRLICDTVHNEAAEDLESEDLISNRAIILSHPNWERGLTSIVAAQLSNEYKRPSFLLVEVGDSYKGTARSVEGINLFDLLSDASSLLTEFGGHSQAAGFSILKENLETFKKKINEIICEKYDLENFLPSNIYDMEIDESEITKALIEELDLLEPYGLGNPKPIFLIRVNKLFAANMKNKCQHLVVTTPSDNKITCFGYGKYKELFGVNADFQLLVELSINKYKGKEYVNITLKDVNISEIKSIENNEKLHCQILKQFYYFNNNPPEYDIIDYAEIGKYIDKETLHGTLIISYSLDHYRQLLEDGYLSKYFVHNYIYSTTVNNYNKIVLGCDFDFSLSNYNKIIFLERPENEKLISYINKKTKAKVYVIDRNLSKEYAQGLNFDREGFAAAYSALLKNNNKIYADNFYSFCEELLVLYPNLSATQLMLALVVFIELGLIELDWNDFSSIVINSNKRVELGNSEIIKKLKLA